MTDAAGFISGAEIPIDGGMTSAGAAFSISSALREAAATDRDGDA